VQLTPAFTLALIPISMPIKRNAIIMLRSRNVQFKLQNIQCRKCLFITCDKAIIVGWIVGVISLSIRKLCTLSNAVIPRRINQRHREGQASYSRFIKSKRASLGERSRRNRIYSLISPNVKLLRIHSPHARFCVSS